MNAPTLKVVSDIPVTAGERAAQFAKEARVLGREATENYLRLLTEAAQEGLAIASLQDAVPAGIRDAARRLSEKTMHEVQGMTRLLK